jgi:hypothetical protein
MYYGHENKMILIASFNPLSSLSQTKETYIVILEVSLIGTVHATSSLYIGKELQTIFGQTIFISYNIIYNKAIGFLISIPLSITETSNMLKEFGFKFTDLFLPLVIMETTKELSVTETASLFPEQASIIDSLATLKELGASFINSFAISDFSSSGYERIYVFSHPINIIQTEAILKELKLLFGDSATILIFRTGSVETLLVVFEYAETAHLSSSMEYLSTGTVVTIDLETLLGIAGLALILALCAVALIFLGKKE